VSGQLYASATLCLGKEVLVAAALHCEWAFIHWQCEK